MSRLIRINFLSMVFCMFFLLLSSGPLVYGQQELTIADQQSPFQTRDDLFYKVRLTQQIAVNFNNTSMEKALREIANKGGLILNYRRDYLTDKRVSFSSKSIGVSTALDKVLKNTGLEYLVSHDGYLVIRKKAPKVLKIAVLDTVGVSGKVVDRDDGSPLPGVNVLLKGTQTGTSTNPNGEYHLTVPEGADTLIFSYIGYQTQQVAIDGRTTINIALHAQILHGQQLVVVGYGTQQKENLTGAVAPIKSSDISTKPVGQVSEALQGVAPGVTVTQSNGQPGNDTGTIRIRGVGTLNNSNPLILVDGVPYNNIDDVNASDIQSISVLKDAAAASIYGVQAANGVILITTKKGRSGKPQLSYSDYFGWQNPTRLPNFVGAQEYMKLSNLMYENSGGGAVFSQSQIDAYNSASRNLDQYPNNNWIKMILKGSGFQQQHNLAIRGGTQNVTYRFSTSFFDQQGLIQNMDYKRYTVRLNTDINVTPKLNFSGDLYANLGDQREPQGNGAGSAWFQFGQAAVMNPTLVNRYSDGTWGIGRGDGNPIRQAEQGGIYEYKTNLITGNFHADYNIIKGLTISGRASANYTNIYNSQHDVALTYYNFFDTPHTVIATKGQNAIYKEYNGDWLLNFNALATYQKDLGDHSFKLMVGTSRRTDTNNDLTGYRNGIPNTYLSQINAGSADGQQTSGDASKYALVSFFGRFNYSYRSKYLFEADLRRDGSSRFPTGHKWGVFPAFSVGWRISSEKFMQNVKFINNLKLRGSWGELGNDAIGNYPYQSTYSFNRSYPFGGSLNTASYMTALPNPILTWEQTKMTDIGLDMTILSDRLDFTYDYYIKKTNDILLPLPIPQTVGLNAPYQNAASVQNKGWGASVTYNGQVGQDFSYSIGANLSDVLNKITSMHGADYITTNSNGITTSFETGYPIGAFFGYQAEGIFKTQQQVNTHAAQPGGNHLGDLMYKDQNGDGVIDANDRVYLGSDIPRYTYGLNLTANYKNFDFTAFFQGVGKVSINTMVMQRAPTSTDGNFQAIQENSWSTSNPNGTYPRLTTSGENYVSSSYWIKSGAYLRLKNVQIGYTLPSNILTELGISRLRLVLTGENLLTFTSLPNSIDPEAPNDNRYYPQVKTYTFGVNIDF